VVEAPIAPAEEPRGRRRRWPWILGGIALVVVAALLAAFLAYAHTYNPWDVGSGGGPLSDRTLKETSDGLESTNYVLVGPAGTRGTFQFTVSNDGPVSARLLGLPQREDPLTSIRWAPMTCPPHKFGCALGLMSESHPLPVTVPAHGMVFLVATVTQPRCSSSYRDFSVQGFPLRWSALGVHHLLDVNLNAASDPMLPVVFCPSNRVVRLTRLERSLQP